MTSRLCYTFLNQHPDNPGWAYWGDDVVEDWSDSDRRGRREREEHLHEPHAA